MESIIGLVNRIQRACTVLGYYGADNALPNLWDSLPTIVVVGGQSSGKSSVLESIVGRDFLPRGSALVRKEIQEETERVTGRKNQISPLPINLSIYSPNVVDLTLIDLPGITKVAVEGQPETIVQDIENMVRSYVEKQNCVILAITPANQDIATSDAIKLAREVDPTGERTFGVLTKLDLMDRGTNALDVLEGRSYGLQHPWVGIVSRSQADINRNVDIFASRRRDCKFFASSPDYGHLASRMGSEYLAKLLAKQLESVIKAQIPSIMSLINQSIDELEAELDHLGKPIAIDAGAQLYTILELCRAFERVFKEHLDGGRPGGARIYGVFDYQLPAALRKLPFDRHLSLQNMRTIKDRFGDDDDEDDSAALIELPGYTAEEKLRIAMRHLIPRVLDQHGLSSDFLQIPETMVRLVIQRYTSEAGVTNLERNLAALLHAAAVRVVEQEHPEPLSKDVDRLGSQLLESRLADGAEVEMEVVPMDVEMEPPKYDDREAAERVATLGVSVGLVRTPFGEAVQSIEAAAMVGKGELHLTGQLGDVLKESAQIALTWVRVNAAELKLASDERIDLLEGRDIHIHFPPGAVQKDGSSAGVTLVTALVSLFSKRRVRDDIAIIGGMTLSGLVLPVDCIKDKVLAAHRFGIKRVILPEGNLKDLVEEPSAAFDNLEILLAKRMEDVLEHAFEGGCPWRQHL